ncbi:MAG: FHA domain-containing protein [Gemmataceae bacterium]
MLVVQGRPRGKRIEFPPGEYLVGRGDECHLRLDSPWVSRQHCTLLVTTEIILVRDLGSTNGTLINGERVTLKQVLKLNDRLQIGPLVLQLLELQNSEPSPMADSIMSSDSDPGSTSDNDSGSSLRFQGISNR